MPMNEAPAKIADIVTAELVECQPEASASDVALPAAPDVTPSQQKAQATIEQTGADPPPAGDR